MMKPSQASFSQMQKDELMCRIRASQFAMRDLALYLDTHTDDADALEHFNMHNAEFQQAAEEYARRFGALRQSDVTMSPEGWAAWSRTPWPWDKEA